MCVLIVPNFLTDRECNDLTQWAKMAVDRNFMHLGVDVYTGGAVTKNRYSTRAHPEKFLDYPKIVYTIQDRITNHLELSSLKLSAKNGGKNGIVVTYYKPGSECPEHLDYMEENNHHLLRCNILTSAADSGGELTVDNRKIKTNVGDLHCYLVSKYKHGTTKMLGETPRILWQFGYQISESDPNFKRWNMPLVHTARQYHYKPPA